MAIETIIGITILSPGGRTAVPRLVMRWLNLSYTPQRREKLLWLQDGDEILVGKGTPKSSFRKSILSKGGTTAIPRHIRQFLKLESPPHKKGRVIWLRKGDKIIVRRGTPKSIPAD